MRRYETTFIVSPQADDAAIDRQVTAVADLIKNQGGQILYENRIGTRRLAYPIAGLIQGFYTNIIFDGETSILPRLERLYQLEEPYIRFLTIRYEGQVSQPDEAAAERSDEATDKPVPAVKPKETTPVAPIEEAPKAEAVADEAAAEPIVDTAPPEPVPEEPAPAETIEPVAEEPDPADEEL